jgi:hypothetical protein
MKNIEQQTIRINQLLHGYDEGHRLLAGSIKPDRQSAKTLLALSDLSGQGVAPGPNGYITGYPLPQMSAYALARTWLAPEMSRPGCVWTHTLLIDFSDLSVISNVALLDLFQRPSSQELSQHYCQTLIAETITAGSIHLLLQFNDILSLLEALYEFPKDCIFVKIQEDFSVDYIAMALWLQQWPRLQRNFRFCTWTVSDRSRSDEPFDLQFIPYKRNIRSRNVAHWIGIPSPLPESPKHWKLAVAKDAISGEINSSMRKFLWRYGAETEAGRAAFKPLVQIWQALESNSNTDVIAAIAVVDEIHPAIPSLSLRIIHEVVEFSNNTNFLPISLIEFLVRNLPLLDEERDKDDVAKAAAVIWRHTPERIWPLFRAESAVERSVAAAAAELMQPEEALSGADGDADLFCAALEANPKLAASPLVWDAPAPIPRRTADILSIRGYLDSITINAMLDTDNPDLPQIGIDAFGQKIVNVAVEYYDGGRGKEHLRVSRWLFAAKKQPKFLLTSVAQANVRHVETLAFIASLISYRTPSVSNSKDEWASALSSVQGDLGDRTFAFYAFLLARALSGASPEPGFLICYSFDRIHSDLMNSWSEKEGWSMLERELPEVSWLDSWDRALRVRLGVVKAFVNRGLPPREFLEATKDEYIFTKLVDIAASSLAGRKYLEGVTSWAQNSIEKDVCRLSTITEEAVRRYRNDSIDK